MKSQLTLAVTAAAAWAARADIIPMQGTQDMHGSAQTYVLSQPVDSQSFNVIAPAPLASWAPAVQDITATSGPGATSRVTASYSSGIGPSAVTLSTHASVSMTGNSTTNTAALDYTQTFMLRFTIDTPGMYDLSASIARTNVTGWAASQHATLTFGPDAQPPIVSLDNDGVRPFPFTVSYGPTTLLLNTGVYLVQASDADSWSGPHNYVRESSISFSITAVPTPAAPLALGLLGRVVCGRSRRR